MNIHSVEQLRALAEKAGPTVAIADIAALIEALEVCVSSVGFKVVDEFMMATDRANTHAVFIVTTFRTLARWRHHLPSWELAIQDALQQFEQRSLNGRRILRGLVD